MIFASMLILGALIGPPRKNGPKPPKPQAAPAAPAQPGAVKISVS